MPSTDNGDDEYAHIDDDDGGVESDADPCDRCECPRDIHDDSKGECVCGACPAFKEPS
jgi:hypothetical protein